MRRMRFTSVCLAVAALSASACVNLNRSYPEKRSFVLEVTSESRDVTSHAAIVLKIGKFRVSPLFAGRAMVYRIGALQYQSDFYNEWFVAPGTLVTQQFHHWLANTGRFRYVLVGTNHIEPTHVLDGSVSEFYGDYRVGDSPTAVFGIELHLLDEQRERVVVLRRTYHQEVPLPDRSSEALAEGLTQAVRQVLVDFERDLVAMDLKASSADPPY